MAALTGCLGCPKRLFTQFGGGTRFWCWSNLQTCPCDTVGSIEDEVKLLQNKKLTERQQAAAQLRFSEKVILQKTLDAVRR